MLDGLCGTSNDGTQAVRELRTHEAKRSLPPDRRPVTTHAMRAAGSFVPRLTAKVFERYGFHSAEILTAWPRIAGDDLAAISAPERLKWPRGHDVAAENGHGPAATLIPPAA